MHIIHIASELAPLAKVGGLADVLLGLCRELSWKGHDVDIIIPKYDCIDSDQIRDLTLVRDKLLTPFEDEWFPCSVWMGWVENLRVYFVEPHHPRHFFNRGCFYGCEDDIDRYLFFSRAAIEFIFKQSLKPEIVHLHDWQTAIISVLYKEMYQKLGFGNTRFVFTIHNFEYQGKCDFKDIEKIGFPITQYKQEECLQDPYDIQLVNLLKTGIAYSDFVTTVSPTYAQEVKTPQGGKGLDKVVIKYQDKFKGVLNGIDYSYWNPEIDRYLPVHYSSREVPANRKDKATIDKKAFLKKVLRDRLYLAEDHRPIIGSVTRLVPQKGIELIKHALFYAVENGAQFILLGSGFDPEIMEEFHALKHRFADHPNVHLILHHQEEMAHLIFAASDMFIVPSMFEPCGLTQLIALKYGSVPIVRRTGGLADTIFDVDHSKREDANGYTFDAPDATAFEGALGRAINCWFHEPDRWRHLMLKDMNIDYSWNSSSNEYLDIYKKTSSTSVHK